MISLTGGLKKLVRFLEYRKLPRGAILFHRHLNAHPEEFPDFKPEVSRLSNELGFRRFFVFHGVAALRNGRVIVISGPPGIGKTTSLIEITRRGLGTPVSEAHVLLGEDALGRHWFIETGDYPLMRDFSRISLFSRRKFYFKSAYLRDGRPWNFFQKSFDSLRNSFARLLNIFYTRNRSREVHVIRKFPLSNIVFFFHPGFRNASIVSSDGVRSLSAEMLVKIFGENSRVIETANLSRDDILRECVNSFK